MRAIDSVTPEMFAAMRAAEDSSGELNANKDARLSKKQRDELEALMEARDPAGPLADTITRLHGFFTSVVSSPIFQKDILSASRYVLQPAYAYSLSAVSLS